MAVRPMMETWLARSKLFVQVMLLIAARVCISADEA
jgi:hypothetical protein